MSLNIPKFDKYIRRILGLIPSTYESYDATHASIVYFCVLSLKLLKTLTPEDKQMFLKYTETLMVKNGYKQSVSYLEEPHLAATFFCLSINHIVGAEPPSEQTKASIMKFVESCKSSNHLYKATPQRVSETSIRHTYTAIAISHLLNVELSGINHTIEAIVHLQTYDGGFTDSSTLNESQSGLTYCSVAALHLTNSLHKVNTPNLMKNLASRQLETGGHNGRPNKLQDICYSYWVTASQKLLGLNSLPALNINYLISSNTDPVLGGFCKQSGDFADPYHTALGLAALSLLGYSGLNPLDPALTLPL